MECVIGKVSKDVERILGRDDSLLIAFTIVVVLLICFECRIKLKTFFPDGVRLFIATTTMRDLRGALLLIVRNLNLTDPFGLRASPDGVKSLLGILDSNSCFPVWVVL